MNFELTAINPLMDERSVELMATISFLRVLQWVNAPVFGLQIRNCIILPGWKYNKHKINTGGSLNKSKYNEFRIVVVLRKRLCFSLYLIDKIV